MRNKLLIAICCTVVFIVLNSNLNTQAKKSAMQTGVKIAVISDVHYMSPKLNSTGKAFERYLAADRKLLAQSDAILKEVVAEIKKSNVNIVLVSGDLTKDGEEIDHKEVAKFLKEIEKTGKKVFVIDGNHDIWNPKAVSYAGNKTNPVSNISPAEFKKIYSEFGYKEAIAKDPNSLSYVVEPVDGLRIIAMDSCQYDTNLKDKTYKTAGAFSSKRLSWIKNQIEDAKKSGKMVIGMMHHGLVPHFSMQPLLCPEYVVKDYNTISSEFADLGMNVVFTGHFHEQDISKVQTDKNNSLYDIETGSLLTYPCPYRIVELKNNNLNITTKRITSINYNLNGQKFDDYAKQYLKQGIKGLAPEVIKILGKRIGLNAQQINSRIKNLTTTQVIKGKTLVDVMIDTVVSNYSGDEKLSPESEMIADKMIKSDDVIQVMLGNIIKNVGNDTEPSDNNLLIKLK